MAEEAQVVACHYRGRKNQFFGKYKDPDESNPKKKWKKIPGGPFPKEFDTKEKALSFARLWFETEMADRKASGGVKPGADMSWPKVCDLFIDEVNERVRGADASRDELKKKATGLRSSPIFCSRPVALHDDKLALTWLRELLSEPKKGSDEPRDPLTVRNTARGLGEIYKFARRSGYFPNDRRLPTEAEEFKAEISGALKEKAKLGRQTRVACPAETVCAVSNNKELPELRRVMTATSAYTGVRPGEVHGFRVGDYQKENGVVFLEVREQFTLPRTGYPSKLAPPKSIWGRRKIPVHPALQKRLDAWLSDGWEKHVGRKPQPDDVLFPDAAGENFREDRCDEFLADVRASGCETIVKRLPLDLYSLRHTFATIARRSGIPSDARDRLLGHRPKDTKAMHYEDEDLPLLAAEIAKLPDILEPELGSKASSPTAAETKPEPAAPTSPNPRPLVPVLVPCNLHGSGTPSVSLMISAEEERFELPVGVNPRRFSKPLP